MSVVVNDIVPRVQINSAPDQFLFGFNFLVFTATDLNVYATPVGSTPNDAIDILTYGLDYTVTITAQPGVGGSITTTFPQPAGTMITIVRNQPDSRLNNYVDGGPFTATMVNTDFQQDILMIQQNKMYDQQITPHYNVCEQVQVSDLFLPKLPAGTGWRKNSTNTAIEAYTPTQGGVVLPTVVGNVAEFSDTGGSLVDSGLNADSIIFRKNITLTSTQVRNMFATPFNLIPADVNFSYFVVAAELRMIYNSIAYTGGGNITLYYDNTKTQSAGINITSAGLMDQTADTLSFDLNSGFAGVLSNLVVNKGIWISNATAAFATGNSQLLVSLQLIKN